VRAQPWDVPGARAAGESGPCWTFAQVRWSPDQSWQLGRPTGRDRQ
jgi:hypothetical protein